jgi:hypothetical protein
VTNRDYRHVAGVHYFEQRKMRLYPSGDSGIIMNKEFWIMLLLEVDRKGVIRG